MSTAASTSSGLKMRRVHENAILPSRATACSAGLDVTSPITKTIPPGEQVLIGSGWVIEQMPDGYFVRIESRSGLCFKKRLEAFNGIIDADYRGEVGIILKNGGKEAFEVKAGERIAQLVLYKTCLVDAEEIQECKSASSHSSASSSASNSTASEPTAAAEATTAGSTTEAIESDPITQKPAKRLRGEGGFGSTGL